MSPETRNPDPARVLLVDDHEVVRMGLAMGIEEDPDFEVAGQAATRREAMQACAEGSPHLAVVDLSLENESGLELIKDLMARYPEMRILVLSMHEETLYAERTLRAGAKGYVMKSAGLDRVLEAMRRVMAGDIALSPRMTGRVLERLTAGEDLGESPVESLSDRELEVFELIARGCSTQDIAESLHLSPRTIDSHREKIKTKLHLRTALELHQHAFLWMQQQGGGTEAAEP
ncbi:MAG: response regulator transcription factor [Phycisphaerae bacterium]